MSKMPMVLLVSKSVPAKSFADFIKLAESRPHELSYASAGHGSSSHIITEMLKLSAKIDMVQIPYQGAPPAISDLLSGRVQLFFTNPVVAIPLVTSGRANAFAVTSSMRLTSLPNIPTTAQLGYPQVSYSSWIGMLAPAGTPEAIVNKLNQSVNEIISEPETKAHIRSLELESVGGSAQDFATAIKTDLERWRAIIRETKITIE